MDDRDYRRLKLKVVSYELERAARRASAACARLTGMLAGDLWFAWQAESAAAEHMGDVPRSFEVFLAGRG